MLGIIGATNHLAKSVCNFIVPTPKPILYFFVYLRAFMSRETTANVVVQNLSKHLEDMIGRRGIFHLYAIASLQ